MKKALIIEPQDAVYKHSDLMRKLANRLSKAKRGLKAAQKKLEEQEEIENFKRMRRVSPCVRVRA